MKIAITVLSVSTLILGIGIVLGNPFMVGVGALLFVPSGASLFYFWNCGNYWVWSVKRDR